MMQETGADFVEVGIPFSDPLADGPVIQQSIQVALDGGMTVTGMLQLVREAAIDIPVVAFGYLNPILAYGFSRFLEDASQAGISGLLLTDLPAGEDPAIERLVYDSSLALIRLIAPTTAEVRTKEAVAGARGFIYLISRLGVTGAETRVGGDLAETVQRVRGVSDLPIAVGFGIATGEQATAVGRLADGVVVGSAFVRRLADGLEPARDLMLDLSSALRKSYDGSESQA
jgi:tryptophan synthase alpha chain